MPISLVAGLHYELGTRSPQADPGVAALLVLGSVAGAWLGARSASHVPTRALQLGLAGVLAGAGLYELLAVVEWPGRVARTAQTLHLDLLRAALIIGAEARIGFSSGLAGIGGGIFLVPTMVRGFGLSQVVTQGTSLFAIVPAAAIGASVHDRKGERRPPGGGLDRRCGAPAAILGSSLALAFPKRVLIVLFGTFLLLAAGRLSSSGT